MFINSRVDSTTCKDSLTLTFTDAQSIFNGNSVSQAASFILQLCICNFPIIYMWIGLNDMSGDHRLHVDRALIGGACTAGLSLGVGYWQMTLVWPYGAFS